VYVKGIDRPSRSKIEQFPRNIREVHINGSEIVSIPRERAACSIRWGIMELEMGIRKMRAIARFSTRRSSRKPQKRFASAALLSPLVTSYIRFIRFLYSLSAIEYPSGRDPVFTGTRRERESTTLGTEVWRVPYTFHEVHFPTKLLDDDVHATSFRQDRRERLHTG